MRRITGVNLISLMRHVKVGDPREGGVMLDSLELQLVVLMDAILQVAAPMLFGFNVGM